MAALKLLDVTLVMVETREHKLARMAIEDCLRVATFGEVLIITDKPALMQSPYLAGIAHFFCIVDDFPDKIGWARSMWFDTVPHLRTSHALCIQWDSWIWQPEMWRDEFLKYDYIGAPWAWYKDGKTVGNSGFSLVSTRLRRYIADRRGEYPCTTGGEDDLLCRQYRPKLQDAGFVWAPEKIAWDFAFECSRPSPTSRHFGFHGLFNWPAVLDHDRLIERLKVALESPYVRDHGAMKSLLQSNPSLIKELMALAD
jgi:hypothetical protein